MTDHTRRRGPGVDGCVTLASKRGYCDKHYRRFMRYGDPLTLKRAEKGAGHLTADGYRVHYRPEHSSAEVSGRVFEHVMVMSDHIGRPLRRCETVHHINGVKSDNRLENLELWSSSHPSGQRVADLLEWAHEIIAEYGGRE